MSPEVREASPDQAEFLAELIGQGLLLESGVPGVYGHGPAFGQGAARRALAGPVAPAAFSRRFRRIVGGTR